jgi:uncharacterized membrane protein
MTAESRGTDSGDKPEGKLAAVFAILAFIACNGVVVLIAAFSFIGVSVSINPHIQAAAISLLSLVTLGLVFRGFQSNRKIGPLILAIAATVTLIATMYIHFNKIAESLGLLALFASALWSWQINRSSCGRKSVQ